MADDIRKLRHTAAELDDAADMIDEILDEFDALSKTQKGQDSRISANESAIYKVAEQAALNRVSIGLQRKNLLQNNCKDFEKNGIKAVINQNGSIKLTGRNTSSTAFILYWNLGAGTDSAESSPSQQYNNNRKFIPSGDYILSEGGDGYQLQVRSSKDNSSDNSVAVTAIGSGKEVNFTITDEQNYVWVRLYITSSADFGEEGTTIYPMIRPAEITDDTYVPYVPSLQEQITSIYGYSKEIPNGANLNDYVSWGAYTSPTANTSRTLFNIPYTSGGFRLEVCAITPSSNAIIQRVFPNSTTSGKFYYRHFGGGNWSPWFVISGEETPTLNTVSTLTTELEEKVNV